MRCSRVLDVLIGVGAALCMLWAAVWMVNAVFALLVGMTWLVADEGGWGSLLPATTFCAAGLAGVVGVWGIERARRGREGRCLAPRGFAMLPATPVPTRMENEWPPCPTG